MSIGKLGLVPLIAILGLLPAVGGAAVDEAAVTTTQLGKVADATSLPGGASADWWAAVQDKIRRSEYLVTWQDQTNLRDLSAAYQAPNRAHNLRTYFTPKGIRVMPRADVTPGWEWGLSLVGYGYVGEIRPVATVRLAAADNRIEYRRSKLTEWYVNNERGLQRGFTIASPPALASTVEGTSNLVLELALTGGARFDGYEVNRDSDTIMVGVTDLLPASKGVMYTAVYGTVETNIALSTDFEPGRTYTVHVNDFTKTFVGEGAVTDAADPTPNPPPAPSFGRTFSLELGDDVRLGGRVAVEFTSVLEDSRCPANVVCVWAGRATVMISLTSLADGATKTVELTLGETAGGRSDVAVLGDLKLQILQLDPYPGTGAEGPPSVTLNVSRSWARPGIGVRPRWLAPRCASSAFTNSPRSLWSSACW